MMDRLPLDAKIRARGREFFENIRGEKPSVFDKGWWTGKVMDWAMQNDGFKVQLFRFVDVLPTLTTVDSVVSHVQEYFGKGDDLPAVLKWGAGGPGGKFTAKLLARSLQNNLQSMARLFIIGRDLPEALASINTMRGQGFAFTVDILGEATLSEIEEEQYLERYLTLLDALGREQENWPSLVPAAAGEADWGHAPKINIAVKPTTLYSQAEPAAFDETVRGICRRLTPLLEKARALGAFLCIDMEQRRYKDITLAVYQQLRSADQFRDYPHLGLALQSYLRETDADLAALLKWARHRNLPISVRLVKGAYWDYETITARLNGWPVPVYVDKQQTDAAFERQAGMILENHDICHLACGSHNIRSIAAVMERAAALKVPADRYEFQVLYGMAEPIRRAVAKTAGRVRLYCPFGELLPGMAYLVRRLLENTANESFLRQSFDVEQVDMEQLLADPATIAGPGAAARPETAAFVNEPAADFSRPEQRRSFAEAISRVRGQLGRIYPLIINHKEIMTDQTMQSVNPADPVEVVGEVCLAGPAEVELALVTAEQALPAWSATSYMDRAEIMFKAAALARADLHNLAAWQVLEVGKQWQQAHGDVTEAIDFLEYYAREMIRLGEPRSLTGLAGETNHYLYQPRGIATIISPWNFPLAISCGMCAAALVAGNCVLFKPASNAAVIGSLLAGLFRDAGLPAGVFSFLPGQGSVIGDLLVEDPRVNLIVFTGSVEVGLRIAAKGAELKPGQAGVKKVIAEMGGKNAIIIDHDADLDQAVVQVLGSAFGYQGQKCSACSRVIVLDGVYDTFVQRLVEAARSLRIGPAEFPENFMGPVVDGQAREKILAYIETGRQEGRVLYSSPVPDQGFYVPLTIIADIKAEHRLAREEIFGPVLAIMRAATFAEALTLANSTPYALTGGVFSRSPRHLEQARRQFRVGNLYLNRGITGALVGRQPFGGFKLSGIGSKAGGPDYLLQFMEPQTITENTMRRGFAPLMDED